MATSYLEKLYKTFGSLFVRTINGKKPDDAGDVAIDECLPLSGGTMNGSITFSKAEAIYRDVNNSWLRLCGGKTINSGAYLLLDGDERVGNFRLCTKSSGGASRSLYGDPSGNLMWDNKNIVRSVNGTTADASGNVTITLPSPEAYVTETWFSGRNWYRVWSDGFIEQGGELGEGISGTITLHKAFASNNYMVLGSFSKISSDGTPGPIQFSVVNTTRFSYGKGWDAAIWYAYGK